VRRHDEAELRKLAEEVRDANRKAEPLRKMAKERRRANARQDGPDGFVLVPQGIDL